MNNKYTFLIVTLVGSLLCFHCGGDDEQPPSPPVAKLISVRLSLDSQFTVTDSPRPVGLTVHGVWDNGIEGALADYHISINGEDQGKLLTFKSSEPGTYQIQAKAQGIESSISVVRVRESLVLEPKSFKVIFHIVHDGEPLGEGYNIESSRIDYQMNLLEKTFERHNRLTPNSARPMMDFELVTHDPHGQVLPERGINRVQRPSKEASILFEDWMWYHYWDPDYYINVWVGDTKNGYSWGIYPHMPCKATGWLEGLGCAELDYPDRLEGIALELNNLYQENWVFPHEMGHMFGLFHIFAGNECGHDVDHCADTQQYSRGAYEGGADLETRESCTGETFTSYNIMDYWRQPNGQRDLTYDQVLRIREVIDHGLFRGTRSLEDGSPRQMVKPAG